MLSTTQIRTARLWAAIFSADTPEKLDAAIDAVFDAEDWGSIPLHELEEVLDYMENQV